MGRLDNIIARNQRGRRPQERVIVSTLIGIIVLLIIGLAVFTDLGLPPEARDAPAPAGAGGPMERVAPMPEHGKRVDGVLLGTPRVKPARR